MSCQVLMDVAGKNADEMFEDIGHSKEARSKMKEFLVGELKVKEGHGMAVLAHRPCVHLLCYL